MFFERGVFTLKHIEDELTALVLREAIGHAADKIRPNDLLWAAIETSNPKVLTLLSKALETGCTPFDLRDVIEVYNSKWTTARNLDCKEEDFSLETLAALKHFETELNNTLELPPDVWLELLLACVLSHLDAEDHEYLSLLVTIQVSMILEIVSRPDRRVFSLVPLPKQFTQTLPSRRSL